MSFKIFILQLTGQLKDTERIENERRETEKNYLAFIEAESSEELENYRELEKWVKSGELKSRKKEIESLVFKGSEEYNQLKEFDALRKSKPIKNYFRLASSPDLDRFAKICESEKMKKFWELKEYVKAGQYQQDKQEIESQRFEGSFEQKHLNELKRLKKSRALKAYFSLVNSRKLKDHGQFQKSEKLHRYLELRNAPERDKAARREFFRFKLDREIRDYFKTERSRDLKYYHEISGSHILKSYDELLRITETDSFRQKTIFLKDRKKLQKSEPWNKFRQFKELAADDDVVFCQKFEGSSLYKNYLDVKESFDLERYNELNELTSSPGFLKRKAYLEDKKKWEKTEEYVKEQQFLQLKKHPKIEMYYKYAGSSVFDFTKNWEISFTDDFSDKNLDKTKWTPNTFWADRLMGENFSQPGDLQAYTGGKNSVTNQGKLLIQVRKEKIRGKQWQPSVGFVPVDFEYTSDTLSTIHSFWQKDGIFEAKIRFSPVKNVVSCFYLLGEKTSPQISLVEIGPKCRAGILSLDGTAKPVFNGAGIKNLKKNMFYIFRLERKNNHLTWEINGKVIYKTFISSVDELFHLNLTSLVVGEIEAPELPSAFEVDWVRCYREKQV